MFAVAERAGRFEVALDALRARILTSVELARLDDADDDIDRFARLVQRWREPHFRPFVPIFRTMRALQEGRFADAATQISRGQLEAVAGAAIPRQFILMQRYALARWWERAPCARLTWSPSSTDTPAGPAAPRRGGTHSPNSTSRPATATRRPTSSQPTGNGASTRYACCRSTSSGRCRWASSPARAAPRSAPAPNGRTPSSDSRPIAGCSSATSRR